MKHILVWICLAYTSIVSAQFLDTFTDGDYTMNPSWTGQDSKFVVDMQLLRLQAPAVAGSAYLSTPSESINNAEWLFSVKLDFNPSSSNLAEVYIVSDQSDLSGPLNGYFVLIGDSQDEISLYKQTGNTKTKIIDGTDGLLNLAAVLVEIRVTRDALGNWELFADVAMTGTFLSQGTTFDDAHRSSAFFGVLCTYTSTRSDKFFYDDFNISGDAYVDNEPPAVVGVNANSSTSLQIEFNEEVSASTANATSNYAVDNGIDNPQSAVLQADNRTVSLSFQKTFINGVNHVLEITNVADMNSNAITLLSANFLYFNAIAAKPKDIIISEIFADPSPQLGLPDAEYIEIYNRSNHPFDLADWKLTDGNSIGTFTTKIVLPGDYYTVTTISNVPKFGSAHLIGLPNFPTLNNDGDMLQLIAPDGLVIDSVNYELSWYRDGDKEQGGWSLELIDPDNLCAEEQNWTASENPIGGTPGSINSVFANKPDLTGPKIQSVVAEENQIILHFDEKLENPINPFAEFILEPSVTISHVGFNSPDLRSIKLYLANSISPSTLYKIRVGKVFDCAGNEIISDTQEFALPEPAEAGDVVINELLFNPRPNGVDFVELYNKSSKYINISNWLVGNFEEGTVENAKTISDQALILNPKSYKVLTSDKDLLKTNYPQGKEENFLQIVLPSFPNEEGSVAILNDSALIIDFFEYDKDLHSQFINDDEGVSLERISFDAPTASPLNWKSASSTVGFASPGYENSNFRADERLAEGEVNVDPEIFQPNSGSNDFSKISFRFDKSGLIGNVKIFDQEGRLIKTLANNANLGFDGFFRWDGDKENGEKARLGYYFVWFEVFDEQGLVKTYRKRVVLASR